MLIRKTFACIAILVPATFLTVMSLTAQDGSTPALVQQTQPVTSPFSSARAPATLTFGTATSNARWRKEESEVDQALATFKSAESADAKADAKVELRDALATEYDDRMDQYDAHITSLETELEKMKERLSRRRAAKDEMVDLKLQEVLANADGLGWPTGTNGRSGRNIFSVSPTLPVQASRFPAPPKTTGYRSR